MNDSRFDPSPAPAGRRTLGGAFAAASRHRQRWRHIVQAGTLFLLVVVPAAGLFRIDLAAGSLLILGKPVSLRDFPVVAGLAVVLATGPLLMISTIGTLWCGWACPQNTLSEWSNRLTRRLLGSQASVDVVGPGPRVAPSKNHLRNWLQLGAALLAAALVLGIVPLFFFFPPGVVWSLFSLGESRQFSGFIFRLYFVSAALAFADVAFVRYFLCNYVCLYRFGTLLFGGTSAVGIAYDAKRRAECAKCNYCRVACITSIDPTAIGRFDRCVNCGECADACARLHARHDGTQPGLLRFEWRTGAGSRAARVLSMVGWHGLLFAAGCALMGYGLLRSTG